MKRASELSTAADFRQAHREAFAADGGFLSLAERTRREGWARLFEAERELRRDFLHRLKECRLSGLEMPALDILLSESKERQDTYLDLLRGLASEEDARRLHARQTKRDLWQEARRRAAEMTERLKESLEVMI
jgi:DnaJ-domain-containing protein 1